jgi:energy-coupling factor transport system ATP-binding protein
VQLEDVAWHPPDGGAAVLDGITLTIPRGQSVAIMGPNGSGKSTLARHLNALLLPTRGTVRVCGHDTRDASRLLDVRSTVGMVFQNPDNQLVTTVVEEEVAFGPENLCVPPAEIRARVDAALAVTGLSDLRLANPATLSGGQKQRVAIASVLAMQPTVMVLDEPTAMLDAEGRADVLQALHALKSDSSITLIQVTHSLEEALSADRVIFLESGRVVADGTAREVLDAVFASTPQALDLTPAMRLLRLLGVEDAWPADAEAAAQAILKALPPR